VRLNDLLATIAGTQL